MSYDLDVVWFVHYHTKSSKLEKSSSSKRQSEISKCSTPKKPMAEVLSIDTTPLLLLLCVSWCPASVSSDRHIGSSSWFLVSLILFFLLDILSGDSVVTANVGCPQYLWFAESGATYFSAGIVWRFIAAFIVLLRFLWRGGGDEQLEGGEVKEIACSWEGLVLFL